jgi:alpha-L-fucosidase 2
MQNFISPAGVAGVNYNDGGGIYTNLLCAHPPFQIDGNLGYTAGIAEMLVQSQTPAIQILPALPAAWPAGTVKGLRARGDFEITNLSWNNGEITALSIKSLSGGTCMLNTKNALKSTNKTIKARRTGKYIEYSFETKPGKVYHFV